MSSVKIWPSNFIAISPVFERSIEATRVQLLRRMEAEFERLYRHPIILTPSARSAISLALSCLNMSRRHTVYSSKFSSYCVWSTVTRYANPSYIINEALDAVLAVHQYGYTHCLPDGKFKIPIIEDSCDSIILDNRAMFPNGGEVEIFSLPKIMGSYGGGVMAFKDLELYSACKERTELNSHLTDSQDEKKLSISCENFTPSEYACWEANEWLNFNPSYNLLKHLESNLAALKTNQRVILERVACIREEFGNLFDGLEGLNLRLPPLLRLKATNPGFSFLERNVSCSRVLGAADFEERSLMPIHFGVTDAQFDEFMRYLKNNHRYE